MIALLAWAWAEPLPLPSPCQAPCRAAAPRPTEIVWEQGMDPHVLVVKFTAAPGPAQLQALFKGATFRPSFAHPPPPRPGLADLSLYYRVEADDLSTIIDRLLADPLLEEAHYAPLPVPPPSDIPPTTEDFRPLQGWLDNLTGLGFEAAPAWPGGSGEYVTIGDIEYGWDPDHEDLEHTLGATTWGWASNLYLFHGTSVLGQLFAGLNGYGVEGAVPDAGVVVFSPFSAENVYDVGAAVLAALDHLQAGDVLLIEQQGYVHGVYCPVSVDPLIFDAITYVVDAGIVVVEPGGNGGQDLDDARWNGWFDRNVRDSGSIMVGGGMPPDSWGPPRSIYPGGSSYGSRLDVQAWYADIVSSTSDDYNGSYADLAYYDRDTHQAYTASFGGTSGASPMITATAAILQSTSIAAGLEPWKPVELRAALTASGTAQSDPENGWIGPQVDVRRILRTWLR